ncbi:Annexin A3 [Anabarilius grahami]|uniref:Annexin n=1 Tax=Anabarilius grahami TaxID=495550 RepID=A0A3N0ZAF9_ANAGA|nr:Annexin A3 [Anabarilius grahami]
MADLWPGERGTIKAKANFNVSEDVAALRKAIEGIGTTEKTLIEILTHRSSSQKQAISKAYQETTKRILVNDLKGDTQGKLEEVLVALARPPAVNDAKWIIEGIKGAGTDNSILIEILSSRTNKQIKELSAAYSEETKKTLIQNLKAEVSGDYGKAILLLAEGARDESTNVNANQAKEDAKALYNAGEKKLGTDESKFIEILCKRSIPHLRQTILEYKNISDKTLQKSIEKEISGNLEELLGAGTDETTLTRLMVSRGEIDMLDIRAEYKKLYQFSLYKEINILLNDLKGDTQGNFEKVLVALARPPAVNDAKWINKAMKGAGTDNSILIEILSSRTNKQIKELSAAYSEETKKTLIQNLKAEVSGDYGKAILLLAEGARDESTNVNANQAKEDAKALYHAGEKKLGTDESKFIEILCKRSIPHLRQTILEYKNISGKTLQKSIEKEMSGNLEELLVSIVKCVMSTPAYFAEKLYKSMKGAGTDETTLTRLMVSRGEIDMLDIRAEYKKLYQSSLYKEINDTGVDSVRGICQLHCFSTSHTPKQSIHIFRRTTKIKQTDETQAETVIRAIPSEKSIYRTRHAHTNHDNRKKSDKTKLGCQTVGLGNNKPPTNSPATSEANGLSSSSTSTGSLASQNWSRPENTAAWRLSLVLLSLINDKTLALTVDFYAVASSGFAGNKEAFSYASLRPSSTEVPGASRESRSLSMLDKRAEMSRLAF